jgi:predicted nucleic acid-binding protein
MPFVLDASTAISWYFPDEEHSDARAAWERLRSDDALVPGHWWFEVRNSMLIGERRKRSSENQIFNFLAQLARTRIMEAPRPDDTEVFALARRHRLSFYDAAYLELAQRERSALATLDDALAAAARAEGVAIVSASPH